METGITPHLHDCVHAYSFEISEVAKQEKDFDPAAITFCVLPTPQAWAAMCQMSSSPSYSSAPSRYPFSCNGRGMLDAIGQAWILA